MYVCTCLEDLLYFVVSHVHQILDENGFVGDTRDQANDIQETLDTYDTPRLVKAM